MALRTKWGAHADKIQQLGDEFWAHFQANSQVFIEKKQILVGFALETNDELANAASKLERKNFDFIVLTLLSGGLLGRLVEYDRTDRIFTNPSDERTEGYFRLEWKLAVDRSHLMADDAAFLIPVVIDATAEASARVPDKFQTLQWVMRHLKRPVLTANQFIM